MALRQSESVLRYVAMKAILIAVPELCKTLVDESMKEVSAS